MAEKKKVKKIKKKAEVDLIDANVVATSVTSTDSESVKGEITFIS